MRRILGLLILLYLSLGCMAQLEVKKNSFKEVQGFINLNDNPDYQLDDNNQPFAVLKVKTENINDKQRREIRFEGDLRTYIMYEYKVGEVWLYISYYATYLKISHPDFSSTEFYFPYDLEPKKGYELTLVNKMVTEPPAPVMGSVKISSTPSGAAIYIDNKYYGITPKNLINDIPIGKHSLKLEKTDYKVYTKDFEVNALDVTMININLVSDTPPVQSGNTNNYSSPKPKRTKTRHRRSYDGYDIGFITANVSMNNYNQLMYGLTLGGHYEGSYGFMLGFHTNTLKEIKTEYTCGNDFLYNGLYPAYTGKMKCESTSFVLGLLLRDNKPLAFRLGVGFATQNVYYEITEKNYDSESMYIRNTDLSFFGVELSAGIQCYLGGFFISADGYTTQFKNYGVRVGIGIAQ